MDAYFYRRMFQENPKDCIGGYFYRIKMERILRRIILPSTSKVKRELEGGINEVT